MKGICLEAYKRRMGTRTTLPGMVAEALRRGAMVVTANQRAARTLKLEFERGNRAEGLRSWRPPLIAAWDVWTAGLWQRLVLAGGATKLLLTAIQERQVWRSVIQGDSAHGSLESVDALAVMAAEAWERLGAFGAWERLRGVGASEDMRAFRRWEAGFRRRCEVEGFLTRAELEETLARALVEGELEAGFGELLLVGFDKTTPAQGGLLEALSEGGAEVGFYEGGGAGVLHLVEAEDAGAELRAAAGWLREELLRAEEDGRRVRLAVILPSPGQERSAIERVFREVLAPELLPITAGAMGGPYEFSLGQPLARVPMVAVAMDLLRWARGALPLETVSRLLLSPFFANGTEEGARAELDAFVLRRLTLLKPEISVEGLVRRIEGSKGAGRLGGLLGHLRALERVSGRVLEGLEPRRADGLLSQRVDGPQRAYADWGEAIRELLEAAGWARTGDGRTAAGDSFAFQVRRKWEAALDELATLDFEGGRRGFGEALEALKTVLEGTLFAPESREAPIQIMGALEAAGSEFDGVWFLRAGDQGWPARGTVNPLLGWVLQRELAMPGADLAADRAHAARVTERIARSAERVVFSYARRDAALPDAVQRASGLLDGLSFETLDLVEPEDVREVVALEAVADEGWIPLANPVVGGGAGVLQAQAACGFRAFAERRLWSTEIERPAPGMDASERGNLLHLTLEVFWEEVKTQAGLRAMTFEERGAALDRAIETGLAKATRGGAAGSAWERAFLETQRERLKRLLEPWLEQELGRAVPFSVRQRETAFEDVGIGPLRLHLRMDRVDETEAGDVLIDYKTGAAKPTDWEGERPEQPQLPLYAVLSAGRLAGVAFGRVQPGKAMGFDGVAAATGVLQKAEMLGEAGMVERVDAWREVLTRLAEEFAAGDARVRPKSYPKTCAYCAQRLLCRLDPARLVMEPEPDADAREGEEQHG